VDILYKESFLLSLLLLPRDLDDAAAALGIVITA